MKYLALDTSTSFLSLAVSNGQRLWSVHRPMGRTHSEHVLPLIRDLLYQSTLTLADLDAIIFGQGPGSFTGLRIACGIAQGLAFSAGIGVIGIPTLDSIALQLPQKQVLVCLDARMGQVYYAAYDTSNWQCFGIIQVADPAQIALPHAGRWAGAGDGFALHAEKMPISVISAITELHTDIQPRATTLIELAQTNRYPSCAAAAAELLYIRNHVALTTQEQQRPKHTQQIAASS